MPVATRVPLVILLLASLSHAVMRHVLRVGPGAVEALRLDAEGELLLRFRGREEWCVATIRSRFVHRWMVLLSVRVAGRRLPTTLVLTADAVEPDVFRRLRAALLAPPRSPAE
jgi:hypothetical protein